MNGFAMEWTTNELGREAEDTLNTATKYKHQRHLVGSIAGPGRIWTCYNGLKPIINRLHPINL